LLAGYVRKEGAESRTISRPENYIEDYGNRREGVMELEEGGVDLTATYCNV
jgi:hypothetical protein